MDFTVDITPTLGPAKDYIVAFGHLKLVRDRSINEKNKPVPSDVKKSTTSKLPRNTQSTTSKKMTPKSSGQSNLSGDTAGTSKQIKPKIKMERSGEEKYKPSLIPRRKSNTKEIPTRESSSSSIKSVTNRIKPNNQQRNVQRVQLLNINPEFFREIRSPPKSVTSARPIPTLGHIYRQDISNDTFTDWFLESVDEYRESYDNSIETTSTATDYSATTCISANNNEINNFNTANVTNLPTMPNSPAPLKIFKTTNENVSEWLSTELDHPTRDNESGYRSISPMSKTSLNTAYKPVPCGSKPTDVKHSTYPDIAKLSSSADIVPKESVSGNDVFLSTQPTVVIKTKKERSSSVSLFAIPKINTDIKQTDYYPDFHKPLKYHSTPNPPRKREATDKYPAASYVEYPSEVLQKTTNFETEGCENLSSVIETGRGNLSSQWTLRRNLDSNSTFNCLDWSKLHSSQGTFKKISTSGSWRSNCLDDKHGTFNSERYSYHDYCYHYCWRKEVAKKDMDESPWDYKGRCKRCHKYRRSPNRKKIGQPFRYLRKRMTMHICRHRLNRVWKKTTEKWANWSKSPSKLRRFRMMNYLQKSILWDNANVQTTVFVYHETGTDAVAREQKSAEITASLKLNSLHKNDASEISDTSVRAQTKHANIGPSMFPFLRYSVLSPANNVLDRTSYQSKPSSGSDVFNTGAKVKEIKSINTQYSNTLKNTLEEETSSLEHKGIKDIRVNDLSSMKLRHAVSQDAYTQVVIMCNNADTNIMFTPTGLINPKKSPSLSQDLLYYGVDSATDPITIDSVSHRSINVMTSKGMLQDLAHTETQVSPSTSIRNVSTGILAQEMYQDAKSSVITDTTVPCRRFDNTLVTSKGTILSCTGTKITSVSSANIQADSNISRISRPFTINTAVSTFANTKQVDSSTPALYHPEIKEVALETDDLDVMKIEKSTSQINIENNMDVGVSVSGVVERTSLNCGSHLTQCSVGAAIQPDYNSAIMNTEREPVSAYTSMDSYQRGSRIKSVDNCQTQYSSYIQNGSWSQDEGPRMRIGRSRLLSVRALLPDAAEGEAQVQPSRHSAETKTTSKQKMSASMFTSRFAFGDRLQPLELTLDADHVLTLNRAQVSSDNEGGADNTPPVVARVSSKLSQSKHSTCHNKQVLHVRSRAPSVIISSHLNASKWIHECAKENKDVHSILTASASAVSESLQRAELVARSAEKLTAPEIHQISKVLVNSQPAINCVSEKPYELVSSTNLVKNVSLKENAKESIINESKSPTLTADKVTSDEVVVKDIRESIVQVQPNLCETATDCDAFDHKSASVLTSRHVLPKNVCCGKKTDGRNEIDCLFVYDRPRCVIHNCCVDVAVQMQHSLPQKVPAKRSSSQRSIGIASSMPCQVCCHRKSEVIDEVLSPRVYKALYDTTKLVIKAGSESKSSKTSSNESSSDKAEIEDPNKGTSQMTSCLGIPPAQCCCMRCIQIGQTDNRSIQAVKNSFLHCPNCSTKKAELPKIDQDNIEDCLRSHLTSTCRHYSNLLTMKLGRVRDNFIRHLVPAVEESIYPVTVQNFYTEACTMKPSGKQDENCEAKISTHKINKTPNSSCVLSPVVSATDLRGHDKQDLQTVYYILSAIEGRVRRLKNHLES